MATTPLTPGSPGTPVTPGTPGSPGAPVAPGNSHAAPNPAALERRTVVVEAPRTSALTSVGRRLSRRRWFLVAGLLSTVLPAVVLALLRDAEYRAEAVVVLRTTLIDDLTFGDLDVADQEDLAERRVQNEISYLQGDLVRGQVELNLGSSDVPRAEGIAAAGDTIVVRVEAETAELAQLVANTYADAYVAARASQIERLTQEATARLQMWLAEGEEVIARIEAQNAADGQTPERVAEIERLVAELTGLAAVLERLQLAQALDLRPAEVIADASSGNDVGSADLLRVLIAALAVGLALGLVSAVVVDVVDDVIRTGDDLARAHTGARPYALVPDDPSAANGTAALRRSQDPASVAYRVLRNQVLATSGPHQVVQITSITEGDGATTIAANLGVALAEHGGSVVVVDLDLRTPRIHTVFGVDGTLGLVDVLAGDLLDLALLPLDERLQVLAAGTVPPDPTSLVAGPGLERLVDELRRRFDHVVIDTPPLESADDAALVAPLGDLVLLVVGAGTTSARQLHRATSRFDELNVAVDGYVLNRALLRRSIGRRRLDRPTL